MRSRNDKETFNDNKKSRQQHASGAHSGAKQQRRGKRRTNSHSGKRKKLEKVCQRRDAVLRNQRIPRLLVSAGGRAHHVALAFVFVWRPTHKARRRALMVEWMVSTRSTQPKRCKRQQTPELVSLEQVRKAAVNERGRATSSVHLLHQRRSARAANGKAGKAVQKTQGCCCCCAAAAAMLPRR